ncbi:MAG: hypothetical protein ACXW39_09570, partial [Nitrospira sp.]
GENAGSNPAGTATILKGYRLVAETLLLMPVPIPANEPFLEGAVFFQFACYGYGTPAQSDYMTSPGSER